MSRSGYSDDCDDYWGLIRYRGQVASAIRGKRGQSMLRELRDALDEMPVKALAGLGWEDDGLFDSESCMPCALGALMARGWSDAEQIAGDDHETIANRLDVAPCLVAEVEFMNDEAVYFGETPEARWRRMREWVGKKINQETKP